MLRVSMVPQTVFKAGSAVVIFLNLMMRLGSLCLGPLKTSGILDDINPSPATVVRPNLTQAAGVDQILERLLLLQGLSSL